MRRKLHCSRWRSLACLFPPLPSSLLERAQTKRGACLSLKRVFVSMVTCLLHLQSCKVGNSITGLCRRLLLKWCLILAVCFIHLCCSGVFWIWWFCFPQMEEVKQNEADCNGLRGLLGTLVGGCRGLLEPLGDGGMWGPGPPLHRSPAVEPSTHSSLEMPCEDSWRGNRNYFCCQQWLTVNGFHVLSMRCWCGQGDFLHPCCESNCSSNRCK